MPRRAPQDAATQSRVDAHLAAYRSFCGGRYPTDEELEEERKQLDRIIAAGRAEYTGRLKHLQPKLIEWRDGSRRSFTTLCKWAKLDPDEDYEEVALALGENPDHDRLREPDEMPSIPKPDWDFTRPEGDRLRTMSPLQARLFVELARVFVPETVRRLEEQERLGTLWKPTP